MKQSDLKRLTALLLCAVLAVSSLPAAMAAGMEEEPDGTPEAVTEPAAAGLTPGEVGAVIGRGITGWVFPMEASYYAAIYDYAGCRGSAAADLLSGFVNGSCTNFSHAFTPNDGLDIRAGYGASLYAPAGGTLYFAAGRIVVEQNLGNGYSYYLILENTAGANYPNGSYVNPGDLIGTAAGDIHYLAVMTVNGKAAAIAADEWQILTNLRSSWVTQAVGDGLICVNPQPTSAAQGSSVTGYLAGPSYTFPTASAQPVETLPTQPEAPLPSYDGSRDADKPTEATVPVTEPAPTVHTEHIWDGGYYSVMPTHTTPGTVVYTCSVCGATRQDTVAASGEHVFDQANPSPMYLARAASCAAPAAYYWSCSCGAQGTATFESGSALDHTYSSAWNYNDTYHWHDATCGHNAVSAQAAHSWDAGTVVTAATHTASGTMRYTCTVCGMTRTDTISGQGHVYDQQIPDARYLVSAATCESAAVYRKSCICGEAGTETFTYGDPKGHTFAEGWSSDANQHWKAAVCEHTSLRNQVAEHIWNQGEVTTQPTSTTAGVRTYTCTVCRATRTESIDPTTHTHTFSNTWSYNDYGHWHAATCGDTSDISSYGQHVWNGGVTSWQYYNGVQHQTMVYTCLTCGMTKTEYVHAFTQQNASSAYLKSQATCTTPATYYLSCVCGEKGTDTFTYGSARGHSYSGNWSSDASYHWHTCSLCGTRGEIAQHSYDSTSQKCTTCGYSSADAHVHASHLTRVAKKEATCTTAGNNAYYTCSCGSWFADASATTEITDRNSVVIPATGHVDANNDGRCDVCKERINTGNVEYTMTEGAGATWINNSTTGLVFRTNADYSKFDHVEVDSKTVSGFNYTVSAGSTIVQLNADYLKQLTTGSHTIAIVSTDGRADAAFTVKAAAAERNGSGVWVLVAVIAMLAILGAIGVAAYLFITGGTGTKPKKKGGKFAK